MPYTINRYNGTELTVLEDGTINSTTSLNLIGKNYFGYGEVQNENFIFLLENFSNSVAPNRPISGQLWFDSLTKTVNVYDGVSWVPSSKAIVSEAEPESVTSGTFWLNSVSGVLSVWNGTQWSFVGPDGVQGFGTTRAVSSILYDIENNPHPVILFKVDDTTVAIASSTTFSLRVSSLIPGFSTLVNGITLSGSSKIKSNIEGTVDQAKKLEISRLINGVPFNGQNDITIRATTRNKLTPGQYLVGDEFDGSSPETWTVLASSSNEADKLVVRNSQGDFSARNITANFIGNLSGNVSTTTGTSNFNVVTANSFVGVNFSGSASSALKLSTPRLINSVAFDGTQDITVAASAQTLTGTYLNAGITISNLQQLGQLQFLNVSSSGISVGDGSQKLRLTSSNLDSLIYSETGNLKLGASTSPEITILNISNAVSQGAPSGQSALIPTFNSNIGTPTKKWKGVYTDNVYSSTISPSAGSTVSVYGNLTVTGNFTVQGTVTAVNSTQVEIVDKMIVVASNATTSLEADGAGVEVAGAGASIFYSQLGDQWNINKPLNAGVNDISTTGLFRGTATSARYADLAEKYLADNYYGPGTVLMFGGNKEVTLADEGTKKVAGVVSANPAYLMNDSLQDPNAVSIALQGRVPVLVRGKITKGDMLVSAGGGRAMACEDPLMGMVIGKALEDFNGNLGIIEVVVGRI
jgi:hypothetical protein